MITASELVNIALDTIIPKIQAFCPTFPWRINEFVVRDTEWVDLSAHNSESPYFYSQCLQNSRKKPDAYTFKTKQFSLAVVVPATQWAEYEAFIDLGTLPSDSQGHGDEVSAPLTNTQYSCLTCLSANSQELGDEVTVTHTSALSTFMPTRIAGRISPGESSKAPSLFLSSTSASMHDRTTTPVVMKRGVVSPPPAARSPPRKIPAIMPFSSIDRTNLLKDALKFGGTSELDVNRGEHVYSLASYKLIYHVLSFQ